MSCLTGAVLVLALSAAAFCVHAQDPPGRCSGINFEPFGNEPPEYTSAVTVTWNAPTTGTGPFTYEVLFRPADRSTPYVQQFCGNSTQRTCIASFLSPGTAYLARVRAHNEFGFSNAHRTYYPVIGKLTDVHVVDVVSTGVKFAWTPPGGLVSQYDYEYRTREFESAWSSWTLSTTTDTSLVFDGLAPRTQVALRVQGVNPKHTTAWVEASALTRADDFGDPLALVSEGEEVQTLVDFIDASIDVDNATLALDAQRLVDARLQMDVVSVLLESLESSIVILQGSIGGVKTQLTELENEQAAQQAEASSDGTVLQSVSSVLATVETRLDDLSSKVIANEGKYDSLKSDVDTNSAKLSLVSSRLASARTGMATFAGRVGSLESSESDLFSLIGSGLNDLSYITNFVDSLQVRVANMQADHDQIDAIMMTQHPIPPTPFVPTDAPTPSTTFSPTPVPTTGPINIAGLGATSMSSVVTVYNGALCVDGNFGSICHTEGGPGEWFRVDFLTFEARVVQFSYHRRLDCCSDRMTGATVDVLDSVGGVLATRTIIDGTQSTHFGFDPPIDGVRAVLVTTEDDEWPLNVAEFEVWATRTTTTN